MWEGFPEGPGFFKNDSGWTGEVKAGLKHDRVLWSGFDKIIEFHPREYLSRRIYAL
jgi:hypothetical protein